MGAAAVPLIAVALSLAGTAVEANQAKQQAKGTANAAKDQQNQLQGQIDTQKKTDAANIANKGNAATATSSQALAAIRASMSANSSAGGTILTGPQGAAPAPTTSKTLLGV